MRMIRSLASEFRPLTREAMGKPGSSYALAKFGHTADTPEDEMLSVYVLNKRDEGYYCGIVDRESGRVMSGIQTLVFLDAPVTSPLAKYGTNHGFGPFTDLQADQFLELANIIVSKRHYQQLGHKELFVLEAILPPQPAQTARNVPGVAQG